jgi:hypothetical protein
MVSLAVFLMPSAAVTHSYLLIVLSSADMTRTQRACGGGAARANASVCKHVDVGAEPPRSAPSLLDVEVEVALESHSLCSEARRLQAREAASLIQCVQAQLHVDACCAARRSGGSAGVHAAAQWEQPAAVAAAATAAAVAAQSIQEGTWLRAVLHVCHLLARDDCSAGVQS